MPGTKKYEKIATAVFVVVILLLVAMGLWFFFKPTKQTTDTQTLAGANGDATNAFNPALYNNALAANSALDTAMTDDTATATANNIHNQLHGFVGQFLTPQDQTNAGIRVVIESLTSKLQVSQLSSKYLALYGVGLLADINNENQAGLFKSGDIIADLTTYANGLP